MSEDSAVVFDEQGNAILVKGQVLLEAAAPVAEPEVDDSPPLERSVKPDDVGWDEWSRRQNAVSTLAREFDEVEEGDIRELIGGKTTRDLSDEEVTQLQHDIRVHRISDITDVLDGQLRSTADRLKRGRRTVRVSAPRGWLKRAFGRLDQDGVERVCAHLISRGHDSKTIKDKVVSRVADEGIRDAIAAKIDADDLKVKG